MLSADNEVGFCHIYQLQSQTLNEVFYKVFIKSPRVLILYGFSWQMETSKVLTFEELQEDTI